MEVLDRTKFSARAAMSACIYLAFTVEFEDAVAHGLWPTWKDYFGIREWGGGFQPFEDFLVCPIV
jgi:hypothetical protein